TSVLPLTDGKILLLGSSLFVNGKQSIAIRLNPDGSLDSSFQLQAPFGHIDHWSFPPFAPMFAASSDGKLFLRYGGHLLRFHNDGTPDTSFKPSDESLLPGIPDSAQIFPLRDGGLFVWEHDRHVRLNSDGTEDRSFHLEVPPFEIATFVELA